MDWKQSLDRYLTREPDTSFDDWCERVTDKISADIYLEYEKLFDEYDGIMDKWLNKLYNKNFPDTLSVFDMMEYCAAVIERALKIYKPKKQNHV